MLLMLTVVLRLRPVGKCGIRVGDGSSRSSPGVIGSGSGSKGEKGVKEMLRLGAGDGVGDVVVEIGASLK